MGAALCVPGRVADHPDVSQAAVELQRSRSRSRIGERPGAPRLPQHNSVLLSEAIPGEIAAKYTQGPLIGRGQFGTVYACTDKATGEQLALKAIKKNEPGFEAAVIAEIQNEICILDHMQGHPKIIRLRDVHEDASSISIVMDRCHGGGLAAMHRKSFPHGEARVARLFKSIIKSVLHCHQSGVVRTPEGGREVMPEKYNTISVLIHRDLKLDNFLLTTNDDFASLKLSDFGLSTFFKPGERLSERVGSPYYVAPEVLQKNYGAEADLWSCGVILYVLLSNEYPFEDSTVDGVLRAVMHARLTFSATAWRAVSSDAKMLVRRLLDRDPSKRITAEKVLAYPWVVKHAGEANVTATLGGYGVSSSSGHVAPGASAGGVGPPPAGLPRGASAAGGATARGLAALYESGGASSRRPSLTPASPSAPGGSHAGYDAGRARGDAAVTDSASSSRGAVAREGLTSHPDALRPPSVSGRPSPGAGAGPPTSRRPSIDASHAGGGVRPGPGSVPPGSHVGGGSYNAPPVSAAASRPNSRGGSFGSSSGPPALAGPTGAGMNGSMLGGHPPAGAPPGGYSALKMRPGLRESLAAEYGNGGSPRVFDMPVQPADRERVTTFLEIFTSRVPAAYTALLRAASPEAVADATGGFYGALEAVGRCLETLAAPLARGPFFLGREPSVAEANTAPTIMRILFTLPEVRSLDVVDAARALQLPRLAAWLQAVAGDPARCCDVAVAPEYALAMARKMYVTFDHPAPAPAPAAKDPAQARGGAGKPDRDGSGRRERRAGLEDSVNEVPVVPQKFEP